MKFLLSLFVMICACSHPAPIVVHGYCDKMSYDSSDTIQVHLHSPSKITYDCPINDFNGNEIGSFSVDLLEQQITNDRPYRDGFGYIPNTTLPASEFPPGYHLIANKVPLIIKSKKPEEIVIVIATNTTNAYTTCGGKSLYGYNSSEKKAATQVSFQRPIHPSNYPKAFIEWIQEHPEYKTSYISDYDLDDYTNIDGAKLLILPGHSEYWSLKARRNFDRFIDEGNNALIMSGNTMWWQVRYTESGNALVCMKGQPDSFPDPEQRTIRWSNKDLAYPIMPSIGLQFTNGGYGLKEDKGWDGYKITNPESPLLANTNLQLGEVLSVPSVEYDGAPLVFSEDSSQVTLPNPGYYNYELIGYDLASRNSRSNGAWIAMQKTKTSGIVINTGSTNWCSHAVFNGKDGGRIQQITQNMIRLLSETDQPSVFSRPSSE